MAIEVFKKIVADDGAETYEPVNLAEVELPEDHPTVKSLKATREESKARRLKLTELTKQVNDLRREEVGEDAENEPDEEPVSPPAKTSVKPPKPAASVDEVLAALDKRNAEKAAADVAHKTSVETILKTHGLSETFRPIIDAIPDPVAAATQAAYLAKTLGKFDVAPSDGAGSHDKSSMLAKASASLGFKSPPPGDD